MIGPLARLASELTHRVLFAQATVAELATAHRISVVEASYTAGPRQLLVEGGHRFLGEPTIHLIATPAGFLGWCKVLGVGRVAVRRGGADITARTGGVVHVEHRWQVVAHIGRSKTFQPAEDLPGDPVPWRHEQASVTVERLAYALEARGLA